MIIKIREKFQSLSVIEEDVYPTTRRVEMKYRIVKYKNGYFGVQRGFLFWWKQVYGAFGPLTSTSLGDVKEKMQYLLNHSKRGYRVVDIVVPPKRE